MGWKLRKERRLTSSRSTGDLLKSVRINREKLLHRATTDKDINGGLRRGGSNYPRRDPLDGDSSAVSGYLYVLTDGGFWFRMWVKLGGERLETFYSSSDKLPLQVVHLADGSTSLVIPATIEADCPEDFLFPLHVVKKEQPVICLATENSREQERWASAIQNCLQTRSLDIEGLNLECSSSSVVARKEAASGTGADRNSLLNKLDLLEELLAQRDKCGDLGKDKKTLDLCQKMVDADNWYDRILISEQQEALRRATYLKQRKISTQLKADTIRKQLSKSSKSSGKRRPKSLCVSETEEVQEFYEEQLEELNNKLQNIHTSLGKTELQAEVAYRKLGRKRESELKRLHSDADLGCIAGGGSPLSFLKRSSDPHLPTICVSRSQEDCRVERKPSKGSFIRKNSPKSVKKYFSDGLKFSSSTTSIWEPSQKKSNGAASANQNQGSTSTKNRISPLRLLGNFVDNQLLRARNKGKKVDENSALNRKSESDSAEEAENCPRRARSSVNDTSCRGLVHDKAVPSPSPPSEPQLSERSSASSEKLRTEIDPNALAEIEAFECLTEQFLQDFQQVK